MLQELLADDSIGDGTTVGVLAVTAVANPGVVLGGVGDANVGVLIKRNQVLLGSEVVVVGTDGKGKLGGGLGGVGGEGSRGSTVGGLEEGLEGRGG